MKKRRRPRFAPICILLLAVLVPICGFDIYATAQNLGGPPKDQDEGFGISPIPIIQPVTEEGAGFALVYRYHLNPQNQTSSSSSTALGGFVTGNRSWAVGASQRFYFKGDRWRVRLAGSYANIRYNFYGLGTAAGDAGISVLMEQDGFGALGEVLYRFGGLWYGGAIYRFLNLNSSFRPNPQFDPSVINPDQMNVHTAFLGPRVTRDSRSDTDYPRDGSLFDLRAELSGQKAGSELNYQTYTLAYNKYFTVRPSQVLAIRGSTCFARGNVPFFDQCVLSASENLRGYRASRYMDRNMFASQAEYRWEAWKRVGFVAFGGAGEVGGRLEDFSSHNLLPGGGAGVRYRITRESHVNARFDYAWGKHSHEIYVFIGEAF